MLLNPDMKNRYSLDENMIVSAGTLPDLDEAYSRYDTFLIQFKWQISHYMGGVYRRARTCVTQEVLPTRCQTWYIRSQIS